MNLQDLAQPGDLLFYKVTSTSGLRAKLIGWLEKFTGQGSGTYDHVSIVDIDNLYQYEATIPKVRKSLIDWNSGDFELYRVKDINKASTAAILEEAKSRIGEWYGLGKSVKSLLKKFRLEICTHYAIDCIIIGSGLDLTQGTGEFVTSPDELSKSPFLQKVEVL